MSFFLELLALYRSSTDWMAASGREELKRNHTVPEDRV